MRIAFIAKFQNVWDEGPIADALEANGCEVLRLEENQDPDSMLQRIEEFKPKLVLWMKLKTARPLEFIEKLKLLKIPTVSWTFDLFIGHPAREWAIDGFPFLKADYVILTDGGHESDYAAHGIKKFTLRQALPPQFAYLGKEQPKFKHDIIFVGTENVTFPYRQKTMDFLAKTYGDRFKWYGRRNDKEIRGEDLNDLYVSAKVIIGDSMYADNYWSNRIYEVLGRGGFCIYPRVKGMEKEFEPYKEFVPYNWGDYEGLKEKIDFFLSHDEERDKIRMAGFKRVKNNYLWPHRAKEFIKLCQKLLTR